MGVREQLVEPWGIVAAGVLGGLGGAVTAALAGAPVAVPIGLGIAGVVYGLKVGLASLMTPRRHVSADAAALPTPPRGSPQERWLRRAEAALDTLRQQTESPSDPTLRQRICDVDDEAAAAAGDLARLAGQVTLIDQAAGRVDADALSAEYARIQAALRGLAGPRSGGAPAAGDLRAEHERALRSVGDQLEVAGRLREARESLLARMQSAVLGMEGLVARMAELLALHATSGSDSLTAARVGELTGDLEGMRAGLAEAEALSRSRLGGAAGGAASG